LVEDLVDSLRFGDVIHLQRRGFLLFGTVALGEFLVQDLVAEIYALIANINPRCRNQFANLILSLPAKGTLGVPFGVVKFR
jgi:hypothetical protein